MIVARRYVITGRVQGVGFRFFVEAAAAREGINGWVRNRPDGAVEAWIEGDQEAVNRVDAALRRGPGSARVDEVHVEDVTPAGRQTGFSIR
jgi:acylphosphatase